MSRPLRADATRRARRRAALAAVRRTAAAGLEAADARVAVAARLADALHARSVSLCTTDPATGLFTHAVNLGVSQTQQRAYVTSFYPDDEALRLVDMARAGELTSSDVAPTETAAAFRDVLARDGLGEGLRVALHAGGTLWGALSLVRESGAPPFDDDERRWLATLAPHLTHAMRRAATTPPVIAPNASDLASGDDAPAVLTLDAAGRIVLQTANAPTLLGDLLGEQRGRGVHGSALPVVVGGVLAQLRWRLRQAERRPALALAGVVTAHGASGRRYALHASLAEAGVDGTALTIVSITPARPLGGASAIATRYGLTPRERDVLLRVARGEPTKGIAAALGISPHTVQEHVGRACEKVGVTGRRELVAKLFLDALAPTP